MNPDDKGDLTPARLTGQPGKGRIPVLPGILPGPVCWKTIFGNDRPLELELGLADRISSWNALRNRRAPIL